MPDVAGARTLWDLVEHWATIRHGRECLIYVSDQERPQDMKRLSWEDLASATWELRVRLAARGVRDQRAVILALPNSPLGIVSWLAIASNGAMAQTVDPDIGVLPLAEAIRATQPVMIIGYSGNAAAIHRALQETGCAPVVILSDDFALDDPLGEITGLGVKVSGALPEAHSGVVAGLLPTSGTSGAPKLVELTHRNFVTAGERLARNSGYTASDRFYLCSPFFHVNAQMYICMPAFIMGASITVVPRFSASRYFQTANVTGVTVSSMVAPPMRMVLHKAMESIIPVRSESLRLIQYGMSLSGVDWRTWDRLFPQIEMRQVYGQTESVSAVLGGAPWEADDRATIGRPLLGVDEVRLVGADGGDVASGEQGELWVRGTPGVTLMRGYHRNPEATAATIDADGWLKTGDLMTCNADGRFAFIGRRMHILRRAGENISIYELELMMQSCPLVDDVVIRAEEDDMLGTRLVAHVIPAKAFDEKSFGTWCRESIGKRGVPDEVKLHDSFPRTGSGRVIVRELK